MKGEQELMDQYWHVSRCWNDYQLAVQHKMSSEKAIALLQEVRQSKSRVLQRLAKRLLHAIIYTQEEPIWLKNRS